MKLIYLLVPAMLAALPTQAAQLFQWKDAQGHTYYSDQPPPPSVKNAMQKSFKGSFVEGGESYAMKLAREKFPVTLYITACGAPCDQAKQLLQQRGTPFTDKNPESNQDIRAELQKLTGRTNVPVLLVGSDKLDGYEPGNWNAALDRAGYPKSAGTAKKPDTAKEDSAPKNAPTSGTPPAAPGKPY
jgi:glutaredoxin